MTAINYHPLVTRAICVAHVCFVDLDVPYISFQFYVFV
jgi:hypothetical protein